mgnify:CR=1 FL=1
MLAIKPAVIKTYFSWLYATGNYQVELDGSLDQTQPS